MKLRKINRKPIQLHSQYFTTELRQGITIVENIYNTQETLRKNIYVLLDVLGQYEVNNYTREVAKLKIDQIVRSLKSE